MHATKEATSAYKPSLPRARVCSEYHQILYTFRAHYFTKAPLRVYTTPGRWSITSQAPQSTTIATMLAFATLAFALAASAFPFGPLSESTYSGIESITPIGPRTSCTGGQLICNGQYHWAICSHDTLAWQSVADGTVCVNGAIQTAGTNSPRPSPSPMTAPSSTHQPSRPTATDSASATDSSPHPTSSAHATGPLPQGYQMHYGNGSPNEGWPTESNFATFAALWAANEPVMSQSCSQFGQANNSPQENSDLKNAILSIAQSSGVDERFILAIVMQESKGCVRVWSTANSVTNPGLMQTHEGTGTCNTGTYSTTGQVSNPCPASSITQMIKDGVEGTATGAGLKQALAQYANEGAAKYYKAARVYNSGSIAPSGMLGQGVATHCYASDVANRLTGRLVGGPTGCHLDATY